MIADDHALFRMRLVQLLQSEFGVKRFLLATAFQEVIEQWSRKMRRLLILAPPDAALVEFQRHCPHTAPASGRSSRRPKRVLDHREDILEALSAGVHGYIVKSQQPDGLIDRLRYVLSGEIYVPPTLSEHANRSSRPEKRPGRAGNARFLKVSWRASPTRISLRRSTLLKAP